ncbi:YfhO family protein [Roseimarinus sediminis]|uniref:YfhO family protein n=1 Tax=Roseimarinus sediminis TaxID=1610899 RepID=UPI003D211B79
MLKKIMSNQAKGRSIVIALLLFLVVALVYFAPLLQGKVIEGSDVTHFKGMAKELVDHRNETGEEALWTNSLFGGMPAYLISVEYPGNLIGKIQQFFYNIPRPASYLLLNFSLFFVMLLLFKVNVWISFAAALAFGMNTAFFVWIDTGHMSKANTITFIALVVGGVIYAYRRKALPGSLMAAFGLSFMLYAGHPQMTYYAGLMVIIIGVTYLLDAIMKKTLPAFMKTSALLLLAAVLAVGANFSRLYTTYEYGKYSMRGESELTPDEDQTSGLDKSYILDYSYDLGEALTAFIPRFKGGGMMESLNESSHLYKELAQSQGKARAAQIVQQAPLYWGSQPISGAPFYYGAVLIFLFVFGLFMVKGKEKWWVAATVLIALLLSLGKYIPSLAHFMIDYFPAYNKFRDVKNIIVIQHFAMALLGALAVREVYLRKADDQTFMKNLKYAFGITGGLALVFVLFPGLAGDFTGSADARYAQMGWSQNLLDALRSDRRQVLRADSLRTFIFVTLAAASIWAFWKKKLKAQHAILLWVVLIFADMWPINKRYLNNDDFVSRRVAEQPYTASKADQQILSDKDPDYRVLNIAVNPWNDAATSYFHKSIGGYHGAKMQRYQELIEYHLSPEIQQLGMRLQKVQSQAEADEVFAGLSAINMLNTRYVIYNPNAAPLFNRHALGNAWMLHDWQLVANADEEIAALEKIDVSRTAVIDESFRSLLPDQLESDPDATISLTAYEPNRLVYHSKAQKEQLAVFSEIYYPKGWIALIDGKEAAHFSANYLLRAMVLPAGEHEIVFEFKPQSYKMGNAVSFASSLILLLTVAGLVLREVKEMKRKSLNDDEE